MTVDLCLEASGALAHLVGPDTVNAALPLRFRLRWRNRRATSAPAPAPAPTPAPVSSVEVDARLDGAIDRLPFLLVRVLWLIEVCGCSYESAAIELGTTPATVERLVGAARRQLRHDIERPRPAGPEDPLSAPRRGSGGPTSRSRRGSRRPDR